MCRNKRIWTKICMKKKKIYCMCKSMLTSAKRTHTRLRIIKDIITSMDRLNPKWDVQGVYGWDWSGVHLLGLRRIYLWVIGTILWQTSTNFTWTRPPVPQMFPDRDLALFSSVIMLKIFTVTSCETLSVVLVVDKSTLCNLHLRYCIMRLRLIPLQMLI